MSKSQNKADFNEYWYLYMLFFLCLVVVMTYAIKKMSLKS